MYLTCLETFLFENHSALFPLPAFHLEITRSLVRQGWGILKVHDVDPSSTNSLSMSKSPPKVRACLFDMDGTFFSWLLIVGLLIDSERVYTQVTNSILASYGKGPLPAEIKAQLMGMVLNIPTNLRTAWATRTNIMCDIDVGNKGIT
jgi:hypothetical protein